VLNDFQPIEPVAVGVVGGGQLARMMGEAARSAGVTVTVLASSLEESAVATTDGTIVGEPTDVVALNELSAAVDVITFDH
jgi:5-(carboxyamino)imidazole ribonucleotide synthase